MDISGTIASSAPRPNAGQAVAAPSETRRLPPDSEVERRAPEKGRHGEDRHEKRQEERRRVDIRA